MRRRECFRRVRRVVLGKLRIQLHALPWLAPPDPVDRLVVGDAEYPSAHRRAAFKAAGVAPDFEHDLVEYVGGVEGIVQFRAAKAVDASLVGPVERVQGALVDRKSGVKGKSVSVRVDTGGRRIN